MTDGMTLILETSTPRASLALAWTDGRIEEHSFISDRSHNAALFQPLSQMLEQHAETPIARVIVGSGPGSYSGTRVGIAAAQGVAIAAGCEAIAVPSMTAVPCGREGVPSMAIGDARRGSFWTARMRSLKVESAPEVVDAASLTAQVEKALAAGATVFSFEDPSRFPLPPDLRVNVRLESPTAADLWRVWCAADSATRSLWAAAVPEPIYLKPPHITPGKRPSWLQA